MKTHDTQSTTEVTAEDLNGIDYLNGTSSVASKGTVVNIPANQTLKGALAKYNGSFSQYDELLFIKNTLNDLFDLHISNFEYENLPDELDISRIEKKPFMNGSALWYKVDDTVVVTNYVQEEYNIYEEPTIVQIVEPKSPLIDGIKVDVRTDNGHIFRGNWMRTSLQQKAYRWIKNMEKTLFQIEKNITSSAPKGILNLKNSEIEFNEPGETPIKSSMETIANSQDTFFVLKGKEDFDPNQVNEEQIWIPMELTDRTDTLIRNYTFFKEQLKETLGADINIHQKKERVVTDEIENQQGLSQAISKQLLEVRKKDIAEINKKFGYSIVVKAPEIEEPTPEEPEEEEEE